MCTKKILNNSAIQRRTDSAVLSASLNTESHCQPVYIYFRGFDYYTILTFNLNWEHNCVHIMYRLKQNTNTHTPEREREQKKKEIVERVGVYSTHTQKHIEIIM